MEVWPGLFSILFRWDSFEWPYSYVKGLEHNYDQPAGVTTEEEQNLAPEKGDDKAGFLTTQNFKAEKVSKAVFCASLKIILM